MCLIVNANVLTLAGVALLTIRLDGPHYKRGLFWTDLNHQIGLAGIIVHAHLGGCGCFSFTESLILAQDERWWRA